MAIYKVQTPDGSIMQIEGPDGATDEQITQAAAAGYQPKPAPERNRLKETLVGGARGVKDVIDTGAQGLASLFGSKSEADRVRTMNTAGTEEFKRDYGDSNFATGGRFVGNVAATAPATAFLGAGAAAAGATRLGGAIASGGLRAGGAGIGTRMAGGGINGGTAGVLVNSDDALMSAGFGAALPGGVALGGLAGKAMRGSTVPLNASLQRTVADSIGAGYQIPPNMIRPNLKNQIVESISGKQATQQLTSIKNNEVTNRLVKGALGLPDDVSISQGALEGLRKTAGKAYSEVSSLSPQAAADLEALKQARNDSQGWFKAYNRSASPNDLAQAKQYKSVADGLETALEGHATTAGMPELIPALRDARKQIAKTYTVGRALNDASGTIDARVFGRMHEKGLPLSDGLDVAGRFASAFPTISKSNQQVGSAASHNLKAMGSALMGGGGFAAMGPFGVLGAAVPFVTPPMARALMFRKGAQQGLLRQPPTNTGLLQNFPDYAVPGLSLAPTLALSDR